ncbi:TetR/AcrR family transcriptional regulator C-terminal domain-containing protein [Elioraea rosea]|uniref:TetR/AcrR family transcriptional regulator C-terminal domain-containing protein n=1 Tax=Elioraea rosea TaxID=2492390 RepID=UPI001181F449|nr:TetR/AcrR family transcriptional regulator C-terminal domain-containing protein [Elioraea rosea]
MTSRPARAPGGLAAYQARVVAEKRRAILDAAAAAFLQSGYDGTTLEAVARRAGVSTGTLFKRFPTKAALFEAIMERIWEAGPDAPASPLASTLPVREALRGIGRDYARLLRAPGVEGLFRVIVAEVNRFPELGRALYERGKKPYLDRLHVQLQAAAADGAVSIADIPLAARQLLGMINDLIFWPRLLVKDLPVTDEDVARVVDEAVETFLARYGRSA